MLYFRAEGDGLLTSLDRRVGKFDDKKGLKFWKLKPTLRIPAENIPSEHYDIITKCVNATGCVFLLKLAQGSYVPLDPSGVLKDKKFKPLARSFDTLLDWKLLENRASLNRYNDKMNMLQRYLPLITIVACGFDYCCGDDD